MLFYIKLPRWFVIDTPLEQLDIECGRRHFRNFEPVQFRVVSGLEELLNG